MKKKNAFDQLRKQAKEDKKRGMLSGKEAVQYYKNTGRFLDKKLISKAMDSWEALKERWRKLGEENENRAGKIMTSKAREKMRTAQRTRREREMKERIRKANSRESSSED